MRCKKLGPALVPKDSFSKHCKKCVDDPFHDKSFVEQNESKCEVEFDSKAVYYIPHAQFTKCPTHSIFQ